MPVYGRQIRQHLQHCGVRSRQRRTLFSWYRPNADAVSAGAFVNAAVPTGGCNRVRQAGRSVFHIGAH